MDNIENAMSEETTSENQHFATEVEDTPVEKVEAEAAEPKSLRDALERAYSKVKGEEKGETEPKPAPEPAPVVAKEGAPAIEPAPRPLDTKGPQSWKADTREHWAALPEPVKQEVLRRENEISTALAKTSAERKLAHDFLGVSQPYEAHFRAQGVDPIRAAQSLFNADYVMRTGSSTAKAQMVGNLIKGYGVDLEALNDVLVAASSQAPAPASRPDPALTERLERMERYAAEQQQASQRQQQTTINNTIDEFAKNPKHEFFNDVAPQMIALLGSGVATLEEAYDQACYANPQVRSALAQRQAQAKARQAAGGTSLPVKGPRQASQPQKQVVDRRAALEAAWDAATGGGGRV